MKLNGSYRDREGGLHFTLTIDEVEMTTMCTVLRQYVLDNSNNHNPIIQRRIESAKEIIKTLEK